MFESPHSDHQAEGLEPLRAPGLLLYLRVPPASKTDFIRLSRPPGKGLEPIALRALAIPGMQRLLWAGAPSAASGGGSEAPQGQRSASGRASAQRAGHRNPAAKPKMPGVRITSLRPKPSGTVGSRGLSLCRGMAGIVFALRRRGPARRPLKALCRGINLRSNT